MGPVVLEGSPIDNVHAPEFETKSNEMDALKEEFADDSEVAVQEAGKVFSPVKFYFN